MTQAMAETGTQTVTHSAALAETEGAARAATRATAARFRCPCCGYKTLDAPAALALCPVCWWEDDGQEDRDAGEVRWTVNGQLSLEQARKHFALCGAADPCFVPFVRAPQASEL